MRNNFSCFQAFLKPTSELAVAIDCPTSGLPGVEHRITEISPEKYAFCCSGDCPDGMIDKLEIIVYDLHFRKFNQALSKALALEYDGECIKELPTTYRIGSLLPQAGLRTFVYLTIQSEADEFQKVVTTLLLKDADPFILLAPTHQLCKTASMEHLNKKSSRFYALADLLDWQPKGRFTPRDLPERMFSAFLRGLAPRQASTPPQASTPLELTSNAFVRHGDNWSLRYANKTISMQHRLGLHYMAILLTTPNKDHPGVELNFQINATERDAQPDTGSSGGRLGERQMRVLVEKGRRIQEELEDAIERNDDRYRGQLQEELAELQREMEEKSFDDSDAEKIRKSISRAIDTALDKIKPQHLELWRHLSRSIKKGKFFSYTPGEAIHWQT